MSDQPVPAPKPPEKKPRRFTPREFERFISRVPSAFMDAELCVGPQVGKITRVMRFGLYENENGKKVVVLFAEPIQVKQL